MIMKRVFHSKRNVPTDPDVTLALGAIGMQKSKILGKLEEHERRFVAKQFVAQKSLMQLEQKEVVLL